MGAGTRSEVARTSPDRTPHMTEEEGASFASLLLHRTEVLPRASHQARLSQ